MKECVGLITHSIVTYPLKGMVGVIDGYAVMYIYLLYISELWLEIANHDASFPHADRIDSGEPRRHKPYPGYQSWVGIYVVRYLS